MNFASSPPTDPDGETSPLYTGDTSHTLRKSTAKTQAMIEIRLEAGLNNDYTPLIDRTSVSDVKAESWQKICRWNGSRQARIDFSNWTAAGKLSMYIGPST